MGIILVIPDAPAKLVFGPAHCSIHLIALENKCGNLFPIINNLYMPYGASRIAGYVIKDMVSKETTILIEERERGNLVLHVAYD